MSTGTCEAKVAATSIPKLVQKFVSLESSVGLRRSSARNSTLAPALDRRGYKASNKRLQEEEKQPVHRLFRRWQTAAYGDLRSISRTSRLREKATGKRKEQKMEEERGGGGEEEEKGEKEETTNEEKEEERYVLA